MPQAVSSRIGLDSKLFAEELSLPAPEDTKRGDECPHFDTSTLNCLALNSLVSLYDEREELFFERLTKTRANRRSPVSHAGTIMALLGLQQLLDADYSVPFDTTSIARSVTRDLGWVGSIRELGLLTWATATCTPDRIETLLMSFDFGAATKKYSDARRSTTAGLALFLAGLSHVRMIRPQLGYTLTDIAAECYHLLLGNLSESSLFRHAGISFAHGIASSRHGTIDDQMYAVYALTTFARAFGVDEPLESALNCANAVCALQGEKGQWWFLYDTGKGCVAKKYPVYSVCQDGIAPAALGVLQDSTGQRFDEAVSKGLYWLATQNELGVDLRDWDRGSICDSIGPRRTMTRHWLSVCSYAGISPAVPASYLETGCEVRPDHFGWLLFAHGNRGLAPQRLVAKQAGPTMRKGSGEDRAV